MIKKIILLDKTPIDAGDINWNAIKSVGELITYDYTAHRKDILKRAVDVDAIFTNKVRIDDNIMAELPRLKYIGILATGYDIIDLVGAVKRKIAVTNVPSYSTEAVVQLVFAYLLEHVCFHSGHHHRSVSKKNWSRSQSFCYWEKSIIDLAGLTIGLVGFGSIGRRVADIAMAFGMKVLVTKPSAKLTSKNERQPTRVTFTTMDEVLAESNFISLHCPLLKTTKNMVNDHFLHSMKREAYLINTARGGIVDDLALLNALKNGIIRGAFVDVLSQEPPAKNHPLLKAPNIVITPHIAWTAQTTRQRLVDRASENLLAFIKGKNLNRVDLIHR